MTYEGTEDMVPSPGRKGFEPIVKTWQVSKCHSLHRPFSSSKAPAGKGCMQTCQVAGATASSDLTGLGAETRKNLRRTWQVRRSC